MTAFSKGLAPLKPKIFMTPHCIEVPSFHSLPEAPVRLAEIERRLARISHGETVDFHFSQCNFIDSVGVVLLGLFQRRLRERGVHVRFQHSTMTDEVKAGLIQNGFAFAVGASERGLSGNSIPFREDLIQDEDSVIDYLKDEWLGRGWVAIDRETANAIAGKLLEIYVNAFEHGSSTVGVISCGRFSPENSLLTLAVGDYGVGIPAKAKIYYKKSQVSGEEAMRWAFTIGMTTLLNQGPRGLGFDFLRNLVVANGGLLEVYSHDGYAKISRDEITFKSLSTYVAATIIQVTLRCDQSIYHTPETGTTTFQW